MAKEEKKHGPPNYWIDRVYTWLGNFIYPTDELYAGFYRRFWTRWNFYGAGLTYERLVSNYELAGVRRGLIRDLGPRLTRVAFPLALVALVVTCGLSYLAFQTQMGALV